MNQEIINVQLAMSRGIEGIVPIVDYSSAESETPWLVVPEGTPFEQPDDDADRVRWAVQNAL